MVDFEATFVILLTFLCSNQVCKQNYVINARFAASAVDEVILISEHTKATLLYFNNYIENKVEFAFSSTLYINSTIFFFYSVFIS